MDIYNLSGKIVLVNPALENDPAGTQNHIGRVIYTDLQNDDVFVRFQDGMNALYSTDALLILLPVEAIHQNLANLDNKADWNDIKVLTQIDLILRYGSEEKQYTAMELARDNKVIQPLCLETLEHRLEIEISRGYE